MSGFAPGRRLHHRFTLVERIGAGGMSEVWRATDEVLDRPVAVKVLTSPPAGAERLTWREARAAARLTHPNVTRVYDYGELSLPGGDPAGYLVMELVDGQSLAARLSAGPVPWPEAVRIVRQVASALAAAHRLGVVHRDIKPGNVMLAGEAGDTVKVLDFGIAAVAGADTDPGRLLGTPRYAAPERSDTTAPARPESDVYSLGVLLHEALAGHPPDRSPPSPVPGVPEPVMRLCQACLAPDPAQRPHAGQVATRLAEAVGEPAAAREPTPAAGSFATGTATPPATYPTLPLTRSGDAPATRVAGRAGRRGVLLAGAAVTAIVLGLLLLAAALPAGDPDGEFPEADDPGPASAPAAPTAPAEQAPDAPREIVAALDLAILEAFNDGAMTEDAREELTDKADELREALDEEPDKRARELDKAAAKLRKEIGELREEGELDPATAGDLTALLTRLG